jgi:hypothetical protein
MPHMGLDTKTDRLTDCQSQCDFDFDFAVTTSPVVTSRDQSLLHPRDSSKATYPATAGRQEARLLAQRAPNLHEPCQPVQISAVLNSCLPQCTGNSTQISSADYPLAARRIQPLSHAMAPFRATTHRSSQPARTA